MRVGFQEVHASVTEERITETAQQAQSDTSYPGICIVCGGDTEGVEPDAEKYTCPHCGCPGVYGAEQLYFMFVA
jgi:DnaJ-class molecular chaperone